MDFLSPTQLTLCGHPGRIWIKMDERKIQLGPPRRALPLTNPDNFIILSTAEGEELGILRDILELEPKSRTLLQGALHEAYAVTKITKVLEVDRDPISGRIRWKVEVSPEEAESPEAEISPERRFRLIKGGPHELSQPKSGRQLEFLISGAEDVQTARYPRIFMVDIEANRYEIENCEALDQESRRAAERYF